VDSHSEVVVHLVGGIPLVAWAVLVDGDGLVGSLVDSLLDKRE